MACCLVGTKPLNKLHWNIKWNSYIFIQENVVCEMAAILSLPQCVKKEQFGFIVIPPLQRSRKGGIQVSHCPSVHLSIRLWHNCVHSVTSTSLAGSISYLHILLSNFRRCVAWGGWGGGGGGGGYSQNAGVVVVLVQLEEFFLWWYIFFMQMQSRHPFPLSFSMISWSNIS